MDVIRRVSQRLIESDVSLERPTLTAAAMGLLEEEAPLADPEVVTEIVDHVVGLGPLEALLRNPDVSDVLVNRPDEIWVEIDGVLRRAKASFSGPDAVIAAAERVIAPLGLRLDIASPAVDARLADGSRLHAIIPPVSLDGPVLAVRRFVEAVSDLSDLTGVGGVTPEGAEVLRGIVRGHKNTLVSGGTGSGKTTLLNILSKEIGDGERVVTVEDSAELKLHGHVVRLEARPANIEGSGAVTLRTLLRHALRLRPDRIILGEVRGPEALDVIQAMNTGHDGSMSTLHANGPDEALWRLETLALAGAERVPEEAIRRQLRTAVDVVVHVERAEGLRRVASISEVDGDTTEVVYRC